MILVREKGTLKNYLVFMYNIGSILSVMEKSGAKVSVFDDVIEFSPNWSEIINRNYSFNLK